MYVTYACTCRFSKEPSEEELWKSLGISSLIKLRRGEIMCWHMQSPINGGVAKRKKETTKSKRQPTMINKERGRLPPWRMQRWNSWNEDGKDNQKDKACGGAIDRAGSWPCWTSANKFGFYKYLFNWVGWNLFNPNHFVNTGIQFIYSYGNRSEWWDF